MARSLLVALFPPVLLSQEERWAWGLALLMLQSPPPLHPPPHLHLQCFRLVCFSNFLINGEALHPKRFVLNMVQGHHLQLRSCPPLCEGANKMCLFIVNPNPNDPMLLLLDNSDSPSIVEQLSQRPDLVCNTFIDDSS